MTDLTTSCCMGSWRFFIFTMRTEPLFCCWRSAKPNALQMKPLNGTVIPITPEHHPHPGRSISRKFLVFLQGPVQEINVKSPYFPHYCSVKSPLSAGVWGSGYNWLVHKTAGAPQQTGSKRKIGHYMSPYIACLHRYDIVCYHEICGLQLLQTSTMWIQVLEFVVMRECFSWK